MAKVALTTLTAGYGSIAKLNANFTAISNALDDMLSLSGVSPNTVTADISFGTTSTITNLRDPTSNGDAVNYQTLLAAANATISSCAASVVTISDAGGIITATNVEGALQEIQGDLDTVEAAYIPKSTFNNTNTILAAATASNPAAVQIASNRLVANIGAGVAGLQIVENKVVGRQTGGNLEALGKVELRSMFGGAGGGDIAFYDTGPKYEAVDGSQITNLTWANITGRPWTTKEVIASQTYTGASTTFTFNHSLAAVPVLVSVTLKCTDAGGDAGYAQNDVLFYPPSYFVETATLGYTMKISSTDVKLYVAASGLGVVDGGGGYGSSTLTANKWDIYVTVWS